MGSYILLGQEWDKRHNFKCFNALTPKVTDKVHSLGRPKIVAFADNS